MEYTSRGSIFFFFFFNDTATTEIYTLSLHDALPISALGGRDAAARQERRKPRPPAGRDRKSTRLNSSHGSISYAVFCLKKKNIDQRDRFDLQRIGIREGPDHRAGSAISAPCACSSPFNTSFFNRPAAPRNLIPSPPSRFSK